MKLFQEPTAAGFIRCEITTYLFNIIILWQTLLEIKIIQAKDFYRNLILRFVAKTFQKLKIQLQSYHATLTVVCDIDPSL